MVDGIYGVDYTNPCTNHMEGDDPKILRHWFLFILCSVSNQMPANVSNTNSNNYHILFLKYIQNKV